MSTGQPGSQGQGYQRDLQARPARDVWQQVRLVLLVVVAALLVWFALANLQTVQVHFWVTTTHTSQITVIVISAIFGLLVGLLLGLQRRRSRTDGGAGGHGRRSGR